MLRRLALAAALALPSLPALAQDPDPAQVLAKFRAYVDRRPFHEAAFERLVSTAVSIDGLGELVAEYERAVSAEDAPREARVVLARLYAAVDREEEALALLAELEGNETELHLLRGRLSLEAGQPEEAGAALDLAAAGTDDLRLLEEIHQARGRARLAAGDRDGARAAFEDLAALDPADFHLRFLSADALAAAGLAEEAIEAYLAAGELAGPDTARRCRALAAAGALLEARDRPGDAVARYDEAIDLMSRGNWLKRDLCARVLAAARRAGTMEELAADLAARTAASPSDLDRRELHAAALRELRRDEEARAVLQAAAVDFPDDLALGRRVLEVLEALEDVDARVAEFQRLLERHPDQLDLYLDLGSLFAEEGRLEQARLQWARTLEQRLDDPSLCVQLAGLYSLHGLHDEAIGTLERAAELEPRELRHLAELAAVLVRADRRDELPAVLDRAREAAGSAPGRLEEFAELARGLRYPERAREALDAALAIEPDSPRALRALADLALAAGDRDEAVAALRRILSTSQDDAARRDAAGRVLRLHRRSGMEALLRQERERADEDPTAHYLLARAAMLRRRSRDAIVHLEALLAALPEAELGRADLARLYGEVGRGEDAIGLYEALIEVRPASRSTMLRRIAELHAKERNRDEAVACYEEVLDLSPDNAAVFAEVAGRLEALGQGERALECRRQAVRLRPDEGAYRLQLADALAEAGDADGAREQALAALRDDDAAVRDRAHGWVYDDLLERGEVDEEVRRLRDQVAAAPYDVEASEALIDLLVRELEYALALELLGDRLAFDPTSVRLLRRRAGLYEEMGRFEEALADHEALARLPGVDAEAVRLRQARCALLLGDPARAERALVGASDPLAVAQVYARERLFDRAVATLEAARLQHPGDPEIQQRLVRVLEQAGDLPGAIAAHEGLVRMQGEGWDNLRRLVDLQSASGDQAALAEAGARLLALTTPPVPPDPELSRVRARRVVSLQRSDHRKQLEDLRRQFFGHGEALTFMELARARLREVPDEELLALCMGQVAPDWVYLGDDRPDIDYGVALEMLDEVRALTLGEEPALPAGHTRASWSRILDRHEDRVVKADPELARMRVEQLAQRETLTQPALDERLELLRAQGEPHEVIAALREGKERFPDELRYLSGLAITLAQDGDLEQAVPELELLLAAVGAEGERTARRPDDEGAESRYVKRLVRKLPDELQEEVTDELGLSLYRLSRPNPLRGDWNHTRVPDALNVRVALARALGDLDRTEEALAVLEVAAPSSSEFAAWSAALAAIYLELGAEEQAAALDRELLDVVRRVRATPVLAHKRSWRPETREAVGRAASGLEDPAERHELTRRWTGAAPSWSPAERADLTETFAARWEVLVEGEEPTSRRGVGVLYAELLQGEERWDEAAAVLGVLFQDDRDDGRLLGALVGTLVRAGEPEAAMAVIDGELERERQRYADTGVRVASTPPVDPYGAPPVDPDRLEPSRPAPQGVSSRELALFSELRVARGFGGGPTNAKGPDLTELRIEAVQVAWVAGDWKRVGAEYAALQQEAPQVLSYCQWETKYALQELGLEPEILVDLYGVLHLSSPSDTAMLLLYGKGLEATDRTDEALRLYRKYVASQSGGHSHGVDQVRTELERLDPSARPAAPPALPEDLEAAVAEDPKNTRLRTALVDRLFEERRLDEALVHAREAYSMASHLPEVESQLERALLAAGEDAEYEALVLALLERATEAEERLRYSLILAQRALDRGDGPEAAAAILARGERRGRFARDELTVGPWWLENGYPERARATLEEDRKSLIDQPYYQARIDEALAALSSAQPDLAEAIDRAWDMPDAPARHEMLVVAFRGMEVTPAELSAVLEGDDRRAAQVRAAHAAARGDHAAAEEELARRAEADSSARELFPLAIDLARARGDHGAALALLDRLEARYTLSERRMVDAPTGPYSERQLAAAIRGQLLAAAGSPEAAVALWREAFDRDDESRAKAARLCLSIGRLDDAAALLDAMPSAPPLLQATLGHAAGDPERELRALEAMRLEQGEAQDSDELVRVRTRRLTLLRELGRLDQAEQELREALAANPGDEVAAQGLLDLAWSREGEEVAWALLDTELDLRRLPTLRRWAAGELRARGEHERALEVYRDLASSGEPWQGRNLAHEIRELLVELGRLEELVDVVGHEDSQATRLVQLARQLSQKRLAPELRLRWFEEAAALDPDAVSVGDTVQALVALGRADEAAAVIAAAGEERRVPLDTLRRAYDHLESQEDLLDAELQRLASVEGLAGARLTAAIHLARRHDEPALAALDLVLERGGDPMRTLDQRWRVLRRLDRHGECADALLECLDRIDRTASLPGSLSRWVDSYQRSLFRARLASAGPAAAIEEFMSDPGRRLGTPDVSRYQVWRLGGGPSNRGQQLSSLLWRHGLYEEVLSHAGSEGGSEIHRLARAWTGDRDTVLEEVTAELRSREECELDDESAELWAQLVFEGGDLEARRPELDGAVAAVQVAVDLAHARLVGDPSAVVEHLAGLGMPEVEHLADWVAAGRAEEALAHLEPLRRASPHHESVRGAPFTAGVDRLSFEFGQAPRNVAMGLGGSFVYSMGSPMMSTHRMSSASDSSETQWVLALVRGGRAAEAEAAIERLVSRAGNRGQFNPGTQLAGQLLDLGLVAEARALHASSLDAEYENAKSRASLTRSFRRAALVRAGHQGDREQRDALLAELDAEPLPEDPAAAVRERWSRAWLLDRAGLDVERVRAEVEAARILDPQDEHAPGGVQRAWIALALGDPERAAELFAEEVDAGLQRGEQRSEARFGHALAYLALERPDAEVLLRRAISRWPTHERADRARAALDL